MSDELGPMRFGHPQGEVFLGRDLTSTPDYSDEVAARIDAEVRLLIEGAHQAALSVLTENRELLGHLAAELIEHETLEADQVQALFRDVQVWDAHARQRSARPPARPDGATVPGRSGAAAARQADQPHRGGPA
jgi:cell division protease FtsH